MALLKAGIPGWFRRLGGAERRGWLGLACLVASAGSLPGAQTAPDEYQVKAVFLFNFATFVEWPAAATPPAAPFVIGILGSDPFGATLDQVVAEESIHGRPLVVRRFAAEEVPACDILFIGRSEAGRIPDVLQALGDRPVLTVSDVPRFVESGGMIGFSTERGRVRLSINPTTLETRQLAISAKLLRLARIVDAPGR